MSEHTATTGRLGYSGDLAPIIDDICKAYGIGSPSDFSVIGVGYEDCNVIISTDQDRFMAKMFAKTRKPEEIDRYAEIMQKVGEVGGAHPGVVWVPAGG